MDTCLATDFRIESPLPADAGFCLVVPGFLSPEECRQHIAASEARGFGSADAAYPPSYRNNDRQVLDDPTLAGELLRRLAAHAPAVIRDEGGTWVLDGINERFRFCRYRPGQRFGLHQDGVHHRGPELRSRLTFMVYLTDGEAFEGGDTLFHSAGPAGDAYGAPSRVIGRVRPRVGSLILFDHALWHAGEAVTQGVKHILRSDVVYRRVADGAATAARPFEPGHQGYVWTLAALADGGLASGGRDTIIRLWEPDGHARGQLAGHRQSVLGLAPLPGDRFASISRDGDLRVWDLPAQRCVHAVAAHRGSGLCVVALSDGTLATGGADAAVRLWHADGRAIGTLEGHGGWVWSVAELGDSRLVSASEDGTVKVWDRGTGRCVHTLEGDAPLRGVVALPDGRLAFGDIEGRVALWHRRGGGWQPAHVVQAHTAAVRRLRLAGTGLLATAGEDNRACLWRLADRRLLAESRHANFVTDVLPLADACLSCAYDGRIVRHPWPMEVT
jgi:predicted 2-oxoglutarate/Fe(II)-dependent dioxygenase YbiX